MSYALMRHDDMRGADFAYVWRAAGEVASGVNPYTVARSPTEKFNQRFYYPLPAALVALPFASFRPELAASLFVGASLALLAFLVARDGFGRLPMFASFSCAAAAWAGQWSPLLTAAALAPNLAWLLVVKPNLGLALFLYRPSWRALLGGATFLAVSLIVLPSWPMDWLRNLRGTPHYAAPIAFLGGPLLLLALLRWRRPEARLLLAMACVPQSMFFYDQLPLFLIPRSRRESLALATLSLAAWEISHWVRPAVGTPAIFTKYMGPVIVALLYLPALMLVLRRPNRSEPSEATNDREPQQESGA